MSISIGDRIPEATLTVMQDGKPTPLNSREIFAGKRVVLVSVPGAFTPTCSARHLPGYIEQAEEFFNKGIDTVACMAVNDVFVMDAWGRQAGADRLLMLADGNADFALSLGLEMESRAFGMGQRSQRFALVADDGVVTQLHVEAPGEFRVSAAENVLAQL